MLEFIYLLLLGAVTWLALALTDFVIDRSFKAMEAAEDLREANDAIVLADREAQTLASLQKDDERLALEEDARKKQETLDWLQGRMSLSQKES